VQGYNGAVNFRTQSKVKDCLAEQRVLDLLVDNDRIPERGKFSRRDDMAGVGAGWFGGCSQMAILRLPASQIGSFSQSGRNV